MLTRLRPLTKTLINPTFVNERMHDNRVMGLSPVTHSLLEHHLSDVHFELYTLVDSLCMLHGHVSMFCNRFSGLSSVQS